MESFYWGIYIFIYKIILYKIQKFNSFLAIATVMLVGSKGETLTETICKQV